MFSSSKDASWFKKIDPASAISLAFPSAEKGWGGRRACFVTLRTLLIPKGSKLIVCPHVPVTRVGKCLYLKQAYAQLKGFVFITIEKEA